MSTITWALSWSCEEGWSSLVHLWWAVGTERSCYWPSKRTSDNTCRLYIPSSCFYVHSKFVQTGKIYSEVPISWTCMVFETLDSSKYKINAYIEKPDYCSISPSLKSLSLALKAINRVQIRWNFQLALWASWNHYTQVWKLFLSSTR